MNLAAISTAIDARLDADTADGGINGATNALATGYWLDVAPHTSDRPYIVYTIACPGPDDTFGNDGARVLLEFYVYTDRTAGFDAARKIIDRLYGNGQGNGGVPTYGFHRHILTITGFGATSCAFQSAESASTDDQRIWRVVFTFSVWKTA